jgi:starch-binding outer membrane protein, SusD/RagB family
LKSSYGATNVGRISKGAAQSMLAKVYLYEASYAKNYASDERFTGCTNKYALALTYADSVISSNEYSLPGINGELYNTYWSQNGSTLYPNGTPGYRYIFSVDGENGPESVFEMQAVNDGLNYMLSRGTYLTVYTGVRNYNETTLGWGFNCPTDDMYNAYEAGDLRREVSCGRTGDPIYASTKVGWGKIDCKASPTNMIGRKFEASPAQYWESKKADGNGPNNFPYIRYADVLLIDAEAALETGNSTKALDNVNLIRKRARNGAATGVPANLSSVTLDDIIKERHLELALEGSRFFDLVRWGKQDILTDQPLQKYLGGVVQSSPVACQFTPGKNDFFPIPLVEVINSNNNLVQYPGW